MRAEEERGLRRGARQRGAVRAHPRPARGPPRGRRGARGRDARARRADRLHDGRLQHRAGRARPRRGRRDHHDDGRALRLLGPLHMSSATVVVAEPDAEHIAAAITPRTRLLAISHVLWTTGAVLPVHELRSATGIPVLVDGAQSVGAIPVDANGVDFYTISGQKWLCGPEGTGALVVADPDALRVARPSYLVAARLRAGRRVRAEGRRRAVRPEPHTASAGGGLPRGGRRDSDRRLRARVGARGALPRPSPRSGAGRRRPAEAGDARLLARAGRRVRRIAAAARRGRGHRARPAGPRARARLRRLVERRGRPRAAGRRSVKPGG